MFPTKIISASPRLCASIFLYFSTFTLSALPPKNIILILADDQGWNALSTRMDPDDPGSGSTYYQTPRLAKLASEGMRLPGADAELTPPSGRKPKAAAPAPPRKPRRSKGASKSATAIPLTPDDILLADFEGDTYFPAVIPHRIPTRT